MPFPKNKTFSELNLDPNRKFIVVEGCKMIFITGDIVELYKDDDSELPYFKRISDGRVSDCYLYRLEYYDEPRTCEDKMEDGETYHDFNFREFGHCIYCDKEKEPKTWSNLEIGDTIIINQGEERKVADVGKFGLIFGQNYYTFDFVKKNCAIKLPESIKTNIQKAIETLESIDCENFYSQNYRKDINRVISILKKQ